ncbi:MULTISPECIES: P-loop NTPase fold protein [Aeromonas]|uniref:KAP family P-loop NTPase fold protein n=1 Tax=Aeromonas TaxID=642 RepID=UPI0009B8972E|nr:MULTISPECIES: P-loop NTPase fold protein [Aeromonas]
MTRAEFNWENSIAWSGPGTIEGVQDTLAGDRLDRARYAEFLTNYLATEGKQRNYVLNLNAEWGAGKTWFIKRWYMELKQHYPTVYIDAWQQDFSDDPLLTVISSIIEQLRDAAGDKLAVPDGIKSKLLGLLKIGGKLVLKSAIKKAGLEDGDFSMEGEDADKLVDTLCSNHKERYESIQYLKTEIRQWVEGAVGLSEKKLDYPAFILIDELDRCRPSYAVEMLETIKHIFEIPGVVFVLATDTEQLQHAVKSIYGEGFDGKKYFERFFDSQKTLKRSPREQMASSRLALYGDDIWLPTESVLYPRLSKEQIAKIIAEISSAFGMSVRDMNRMISNLVAIISNLKKSIDIVFLIVMYCLYIRKKDVYNLAFMDAELVRNSLPQSNSASFSWSTWVNDFDVAFLKKIQVTLNLSFLDQRCQSIESSIDVFDYFVWVYSTVLNDNQNAVFLSGQLESEVMFHEASYNLQRAVIKLVNKTSCCDLAEYHDLLTLGMNE